MPFLSIVTFVNALLLLSTSKYLEQYRKEWASEVAPLEADITIRAYRLCMKDGEKMESF